MSQPAVPVAPSLADLRDQTLRRLAALAWLADIAESIVSLLRYWLAAPSLAPRASSRLRRMLERGRHAARVIAALEARLRETLRMIEAGVRPPAAEPSERSSGPTAGAKSGSGAADVDAPERLERPDWRERPERLERFFAQPALPRLKGSVDDIVAGVIDDLGGFPAWRRLAQAVWAGEDPTPDEVARVLAGALIEAVPLRRCATASRGVPPASEDMRPPRPAPSPRPPAPA